ncbi:MAG: hypothetical protein WC579_01860 [Candidatus Paceibacterota bacterium]|nr:hypothetical protein [Candidatus Paceibacterota bacterium]
MKKLALKFSRFFKGYFSLSVLLEDAKQKKVEKIFIQPRIYIEEFPGSTLYVITGHVEVFASELPKTYIDLSFQQIVKKGVEEAEKLAYRECEQDLQERTEKIKEIIEKAGLQTVIGKIKTQ